MSFIRKTGIALLVAAVACFLFSIFAVLVTRFYVLPYCGQNPHLVTNLLARQIGQPVTIGSLTVGWDGWNPELILKDLRVYDPVVNYHEADLGELVPQIDLPDVTMLVSWQSLFYRDVRFKKLLINAPRLVIRRNADNQIIVGGSVISAKAGKNAQDSGFTLTEWLRRQSSMEITKGSVDWVDEKRQAPPLRVRDFSLVGRRNAMTFSGVFHTHQTDDTPDDAASDAPAEPPMSFHVQGQPISRLLNPNQAWRWIFRVKDVDFKDLTQWFDFPFNVKSGKGQFENSVTVVQREITNFTLDIQLTDAAVRLLPDEWGTTDAEKENAAELPLLHFKEASGRLTGKREIVETSGDTALARYTIAARNFTFLSGNGSLLPPSDVTLIIKTDQTVKTVDWLSALSSAQEASLSFKHLQLQPLFEVLEGLPLPQAFRTAFAESHYQGALDNGNFTVTQRNRESDISGAVDLVNISGNPSGDVPGVKNLSGHLVFAPHGGQFTINTKSGEVHLPTIFAEALPIDGFDGNVSWQWERYRLTGLTFEKLHVQNDDLEGTVDGTWRADDHWGVIDLKGNITRAKATGAYRYIPNIVGHRVRDWLRDALLAGNADHASLALQGELRHFPFDEAPETGIFSITAHVTGGTLQYQPDWMPIHEIEADLSFQNATMTITAQKGQVDTARVTDAVVAVQKLNAEFPHLTVKGNAEGDLSAYLNFVAQTPVKEKMDHLLDDAKGQGSAALNLTLDIPLSLEDEATTVINGRLRLSDAALLLPDVPPMSHINGVATFTDKEVAAPQLKFNVLGGDAVAQLNNVKDGILFQSQGTFDAGALKEVYGWPVFTHVSGSSTWAIKVTRTARLSEWTISSPMTGIAIDLPAPMNKPAELEAPLRIRRAQGKQDIWYVDYHADEFPLAWVALQERVKDQWQLSRAAVTLGGTEVGLPANNQIVVHATMPAFHVNEWYRLYEQLAGNQEDSYLESLSIPIRFDLVSPEVVLREGVIHDAKIIAQTSGTGSELCRSHPVSCWRFNVDGNEIAGTFEWENALASGTKNGKLQAALSKLYLPKIKSTEAQDTDRSQTMADPAAPPVKPFTDLPQFALDIQRLFVDNRELGHLEIAARPEGDEWIIDDLELNNTDGKVAVRGRWRAPAGAGQTQLLLETNIKNVNRFLTRFDIPEGLVASDAIVSGYLQWDDAPHRLDIQTLSGHLDIAVGRGRFTKIDPGIGRLLAVFSLQALPRRITLDFRDVFSEGFSFDSISGKTGIEHGILTANNLLLNGPSAKVKINGQVDLVHETQQLDVFVRANMSETLSVGAAGASMLVIGSTPIGAAAIGLGALVGQLMFDDPIGKMLSFEYRVEGSWNEPVVAKKTTPARDADEAPAGP